MAANDGSANDGGGSGNLLEVRSLCGGYGAKRVVFDASFDVRAGEIVGIIGHNGAGKTTTIQTIFGMLPSQGGRVFYQGDEITGNSARRNVSAGMAIIPSERFVFPDLTVWENLSLGALRERDHAATERRMDEVVDLIPMLGERKNQIAGTLSGGQQRLVSLGMSLMSGPRMLFLDEPSLGIAPALVGNIFSTVRSFVTERDLTVVIIEQNIAQLVKIIDRVYVMRSGRVVGEESAQQMREREVYWDLF